MRLVLNPPQSRFAATPFRAGRMVSLDDVSVGATVTVDDVNGADPVAIRLLEMGLTPGIEVRLVGRAPFGDPLELEVRGYRLSIRRQEAARVAVGGR